MGKQAFPVGSLDKHKKNVKTEEGWVALKGNEHLVSKEFKDQIPEPKVKKEPAKASASKEKSTGSKKK